MTRADAACGQNNLTDLPDGDPAAAQPAQGVFRKVARRNLPLDSFAAAWRPRRVVKASCRFRSDPGMDFLTSVSTRKLSTSVPGNPNREFFSRLGLPDPPRRAFPGRLERADSAPACTGGKSPPARRPGSFRAILQVLRHSLPPSPSPRPHPNGARRW